MATKLTFEVTFLSDFHVSSGARKGSEIDSSLLRESDGRPALRGSLLGQLLREAARELLTAPAMAPLGYNRCSGSAGDELIAYCREAECPVCWIFGSPGRPRQWEFSSAWLKEAHGPGPEKTPPEENWAAEPVSRVRVNPRTRRAADDQLFVEEVGDGRLTYQFTANWKGQGTASAAEIAFLEAAARNLRHLGKSRRRGRGACRVQIVSVDGQPVSSDLWLERFKELWIDHIWQVPAESMGAAFPDLEEETPAGVPAPYSVRVVLRLEEPLLLARRPLAGNQFETATLLPGSILLGALAARADFDDPARYARLIRLFRRGEVRFSFLTPGTREGNWLFPALAAPLDIVRCKQHPADDPSQGHPDRSLSLDSGNSRCPHCKPGEDAMEGLKDQNAFQTFTSGSLLKFSPPRREELHIRLSPKTQRVRPGDLFSYVALEAGQFLVGELVCQGATAWHALSQAVGIPGPDQAVELRLGKATRRGYGLVSAVFVPEAASPLPPLRSRLPDPRQPFRLLLSSDTIPVDSWGRFPTRFSADWLSKVLGFPASGSSLPLKIVRSFARTRLVDGFNNQTGLPRWRDSALVAGSVVGVQVVGDGLSDEEIWQKLGAAETSGIGLRRHEGYGQMIVNHPLYEELEAARARASVQIELPVILSGQFSIGKNAVASESVFRAEWSRSLEGGWKRLEYVEFEAIARFLRSRSDLEIERLKETLEGFGKQDHTPSLERLPGQRLLPNDPHRPYAIRTKTSFFAEKPGKEGIGAILSKLDELANLALTEQQRRLGIVMLADRVGEAARRARKKENP